MGTDSVDVKAAAALSSTRGAEADRIHAKDQPGGVEGREVADQPLILADLPFRHLPMRLHLGVRASRHILRLAAGVVGRAATEQVHRGGLMEVRGRLDGDAISFVR